MDRSTAFVTELLYRRDAALWIWRGAKPRTPIPDGFRACVSEPPLQQPVSA